MGANGMDDEELVESDDKVNDMLLIPSRRPQVPMIWQA